tara:strand:- start:737 stop:1516 length:780 start_codon:yes stop_codon:yes gene_type:complete
MKTGISIRHDMGEGWIIKNSKQLVSFLKKFKKVDFFEIQCQYPMPLNLTADIHRLKKYVKKRNLKVGLNFPIQWHDRWKMRKSFEEVQDTIFNFANEINADYINIHPESLAYFTEKEAKKDIAKQLSLLKSKTDANIIVMNGHSIFQSPEDMNYFAKDGVNMCLDVCHIFQGGMEYNDFREQLQEFKDKIYMFRLSDFGERPHMQLGFGKVPYSKIMRNIREFEPFVVLDPVLSVENELIFRNPKYALERSLDYLKNNC